LQLAENGIRVNAITPGFIATDIIKKQMLEDFTESEPLKKIARIALFLASDAASYITGSLIYADGGLSLSHSNNFLEKGIEED
jgi:NAD(P)-dependent dehydrogenase (short-subunit alcohol dehydrogenase family)